MPKNTAFEPVITQTGGAQSVQVPVAQVASIALDPLCRQWSGTQTVLLPIAK